VTSLREQITGHDRKLASYRAALDAGADPAVVGGWITETQGARLAAGTRLRAFTTGQQNQRTRPRSMRS
jgi:site-specific DNA recombinase